jgi:hypothetical protein
MGLDAQVRRTPTPGTNAALAADWYRIPWLDRYVREWMWHHGGFDVAGLIWTDSDDEAA